MTNEQTTAPGWRLLREEALIRGYKLKSGAPNTRAFSKLLASIGVEVRGPKKLRVVCPAEIDAAKVVCLACPPHYLVLEGSANWTRYPGAEQNLLVNDEGLFRFHTSWMEAVFSAM